MTGASRGTCASCGEERQLVAGGLVRSHRVKTRLCPGSHQPPEGGIPEQLQTATGTSRRLPDPPVEETFGRSCDGGGCNAESIGWRWFRDVKEWLPVCGRHMDGPPGRTRIYDQSPRP